MYIYLIYIDWIDILENPFLSLAPEMYSVFHIYSTTPN